MAETFVTLEEAASFEGLNYKTLAQRIARNSSSLKIKKEEAQDGGKERIMIALSSLSTQAKRAYKEAKQIDDVTGDDVVIEERTSEEIPWYVVMDLNWYQEKFSKQYYQAVEFGKQINTFLAYDQSDKTLFSQEYADKLGMSQRTLYRYSQAYLEAHAWALKFSKQDGKNYDFFKVLALCRKPKEKFTFPSMTPEVRAFIENIWFNKDFAANLGTIEMLYSKLIIEAEVKKWDYPSYQTVARYIGFLMQEDNGKTAHYLASKGLRKYKNTVMVKRSRDTGALPVMGLVQGDEHTFDCWVEYTHPNGRVTPIKPKLVAWIDTRSRVIMGDVMCKDANSDILKQSMLKMIYGTPGGVPRWLLIDNGKDYTAETMTGRKRTDRAPLSFDSETKGFYRSIGIEDDFRSLPYQPWSKAQIERFFKTVCNKFTKWMLSYTGTLTGSKTSSKIEKDIEGMHNRGELLTMEEFYKLWEQWKNDKYHKRNHEGLKNQGETYKCPIDVFMKAEDRYYKAAPPKSYATMLMMRAERALVRNIGIKKFGYEYMCEELCPYIGEKVDIKWDKDDVTRLYVYTLEGKKICEVSNHELLMIAPRVPQKALEDHIMMQKRQIKADAQKIRDYTTPFEDRIGQYDNEHVQVAGGIDLMVKGTREDKVIALVNDRQYVDEIKDKKVKKEQVNNEYFNKKAQDALTKLRNLG